jgi:hypothetical protein
MTKLDQLGEIVSWTAPSKVQRADLLAALTTAGLSEDMAPEMLPRNAFKRAVRGLEEGRIIRQCEEDKDEVAFQFTNEFLQNGEYEYLTECFVRVNKTTGVCTSNDTAMAQLASDKLVEKMEERTASDITRMIQSLFKRNADLFSVREAGGCYFVPQQHVSLVEQVEEFLDLIGGGVRRFEISNTKNATKSAAQAVKDQIDDLVTEFSSYLEMLKSDSPQQVTIATKKIAIVKAKAETYRELLGDYAESFKVAVAEMNGDLLNKLGVETNDEPEAPPEPTVQQAPPEPSVSDILADLIAQTQQI